MKTEHKRTRMLSASLKAQNSSVLEFAESIRTNTPNLHRYLKGCYANDKPHWDRRIDEEIEKGRVIFNEYCGGL